jgi:hypothetical protein
MDPVDSIKSYRSTNHKLHFTVKLPGKARWQFFDAVVPAGSPLLQPFSVPGRNDKMGRDAQFGDNNTSPDGKAIYRFVWAEVAYFLEQQKRPDNSNDATPGGTPLYSLYRRVRLAVPDQPGYSPIDFESEKLNYKEVSISRDGNNIHFNSPGDLTAPERRYGGQGSTYRSGQNAGEPYFDNKPYLLMNDVVSFDIRLMVRYWDGFRFVFTDFISLYDPPFGTVFPMNNSTYSSADGPRIFDTWCSDKDAGYKDWRPGPSPSPKAIPIFQRKNTGPDDPEKDIINIRAIQVTLRVWDVKTQQSRQVTIVQDL